MSEVVTILQVRMLEVLCGRWKRDRARKWLEDTIVHAGEGRSNVVLVIVSEDISREAMTVALIRYYSTVYDCLGRLATASERSG